MKKLLLFLLLSVAGAFAQGVRYDNIALLDSGRPAGGASIRVCSSGSSGTPCTPTASIFSDSALSSSLGNPFSADSLGNFNFYAACGKYDVQISGAGMTTKTLKDQQLNCSQVVGVFDATAQAANVGSTLLYAVPANGAGTYRFSCTVTLTQAATTSSTLPGCQVTWTDKDSSTAATVTATGTSTANTVGTVGANGGFLAGAATISAKSSTNINVNTTAYASSGATPMQYAVHAKLEYVGK